MATLGELLTEARRLLSADEFARAESLYVQLTQAAPQAAELWNELGIAQLKANRPGDALANFQQAARLDPATPAHYSNLGAALRMLKRPSEAVTGFRQAIAVGGATPELINNLALALKDARQPNEALAAFDEALRLRPDYANGHFNRANLLLEVGRLEEAIAGYQQALRLRPDDAGAYCKLGIAYLDLGQYEPALANFEQALLLDPNYAEVRRNRGLVWLAQGDYARGWPEFEWRLAGEGYGPRNSGLPHWDGSPLAGRRLFVYAEQGLGDTLQFIRYVPRIAETGAQVKVQVRAPLVPLLTQSGFARWLQSGPPEVGQFDVECPLLSLPAHAGVPECRPYWNGVYLSADAQRVERWRARLHGIAGLKVGISWAGNPDHPHDRFRSVALEQFAPLAEVAGVQLISLQKGAGREQLTRGGCPRNLIDLGDELDLAGGAFLDTAAVLSQLDLLVTVDTALAHLAGGMGTNVWVALQLSPDWRWLLQGDTTPWYPSMRLFRQRQFDHWPAAFTEIADQLRLLVCGR